MKIRSADTVLLELREKLKEVLPGVITELNSERTDFQLNPIQQNCYFLNVTEATNAAQFVVILGSLGNTRNAGKHTAETLTVDLVVGFVPTAYKTAERAMCASYRYQAALKEAFSRMELPYGHIYYVGAEPPGSMRVNNQALYGAMLTYEIQLF